MPLFRSIIVRLLFDWTDEVVYAYDGELSNELVVADSLVWWLVPVGFCGIVDIVVVVCIVISSIGFTGDLDLLKTRNFGGELDDDDDQEEHDDDE